MSEMRRRDLLLGLAAASLVGGASTVKGWALLGASTVRRSSLQSVEIRVTPSVRLLSELRLRVRKDDAVLLRAVRMSKLTVTYRNGERATLPIDSVVKIGDMTSALDLSGRARTVTSVRLHYEIVPSRWVLSRRARGTVELWGRRRAADSERQL